MALLLQIGTNFANDYSDGVRGTDDPGRRVGPGAPGRVGPPAARGGEAGRAPVLRLARPSPAWRWRSAVGPELLVVGAAAIAAGWFYTGGSHPYGYYGFGELFVFVFFGRGGHRRDRLRAARSS